MCPLEIDHHAKHRRCHVAVDDRTPSVAPTRVPGLLRSSGGA